MWVRSYSLIELLLRIVILLSLVVFAISHCENLCELVLVLALMVAAGDGYFMQLRTRLGPSVQQAAPGSRRDRGSCSGADLASEARRYPRASARPRDLYFGLRSVLLAETDSG